MNRREALQAGLGILTAAKIDGEVATISPRNPQAFVITTPVELSIDELEKLRQQWRQVFEGGDFARTPVMLLQNGMQLSVVDKVEGDA